MGWGEGGAGESQDRAQGQHEDSELDRETVAVTSVLISPSAG